MASHRWTSTTRLKRHDTGERIEPGETFEPTESELRAFGDHIEAVTCEESAVNEAALEEPDAREKAVESAFGEEPDAEVSNNETDGVTFDAEAWFDDHDGYADRVATVESGVVDGVLDEIIECERSQTVIDAAEARLEEGEKE